MRKKEAKNLKLKKTNVAHLTGGICKCLIKIPGNGALAAPEVTSVFLCSLITCEETFACPSPASEKSVKQIQQ